MKRLLIPLFLLCLMSASALAETWQVDAEYTFDGHLTVVSAPVMKILVTDNEILTLRTYDEGFYQHTRLAVYTGEEGNNGASLTAIPRKINATHYISSMNAQPYVRTLAGATVCTGAQTRFGSMFTLGADDNYMYGTSLDGWLGRYDLTTCALTEYDLSGQYIDQIIDVDDTYIYGDHEVLQLSDKADVTPGGAVGLDHNHPTYFDDIYLYGFDGAGNYRAIDKATYTEQWSQACDGGSCEQFITDFQTGNAYYSLTDDVYVLTPGTWSASAVELLDSIGDPLTLDLIDGITFHEGKAFVKTYVAGPTHKIYEMSRTLCEPDWVCSGYEECVRPMTEASCNAVTDNNACGDSYTGNYSEFATQECTYIEGGSGGVSALSVIALEPEPTSTEVEPEETEYIWDKWNLTQRIIIGTLIIGVIAGTVAVFNMVSPKKAPRRRVKRRNT